MSIEQNKQLAVELFARFSAGNITGVLDLMADDATWWVPGKAGHSPASGLYSKERIARLFNNMLGRLKSGLKMTVKSLIAEDDRVALEVESLGELANGRIYNQEYHMLLSFRDGRICAVREYLDTQHAYAVWFQA